MLLTIGIDAFNDCLLDFIDGTEFAVKDNQPLKKSMSLMETILTEIHSATNSLMPPTTIVYMMLSIQTTVLVMVLMTVMFYCDIFAHGVRDNPQIHPAHIIKVFLHCVNENPPIHLASLMYQVNWCVVINTR